MKAEYLAKEAARLKSDDTLNKALADMRADALNALATADADQYNMIVRLQQKVAVIDEFRTELDRFITAAEVQETAGSFA